ncbi:MAG TPA: DUF456 domain-containing protein [Candidatus Binatia bacterium]|nr:DUF456 domain-containing protein [Candidatus Binatia bacterium]
MDSAFFLWPIAGVLVLAGLAGLILPAIPGAPLIFAGLVVGALADDFVYVGAWTLIALAVLTLLIIGVDFWATMFGAKKFGASRRAVIGAVVGSIAGLFLGVPGVLFGPFIGAVLGEISSAGSLRQATRAGFGATLGLILGAAMKLALAFSMIGIFVAVRFIQ